MQFISIIFFGEAMYGLVMAPSHVQGVCWHLARRESNAVGLPTIAPLLYEQAETLVNTSGPLGYRHSNLPSQPLVLLRSTLRLLLYCDIAIVA